MAIGPPDRHHQTTPEELVASLEKRIDLWIIDSWSPDRDAYPLPFWVFLKWNHDAFMAMLERYRALWSFVGVIRKNDADYLQFRR